MPEHIDNDSHDRIFHKSIISRIIFLDGKIIKNIGGQVDVQNYKLYNNIHNLEVESFNYNEKILYLVTTN